MDVRFNIKKKNNYIIEANREECCVGIVCNTSNGEPHKYQIMIIIKLNYNLLYDTNLLS